MHSVEIRAIVADDYAMWLPLWKDYHRFYKVEIPESATRETWSRFLDPIEPMHAALAVMGEHAFGLAHAIYHRSTWTSNDYCYLQDLFVAPDARGGGIGRALIEHVYADARRRKAARVHWLTHESNQIAMKLYDEIGQRSGFVQYRKLLDR
jgi:GNAT superfamily N-acetyltransferase